MFACERARRAVLAFPSLVWPSPVRMASVKARRASAKSSKEKATKLHSLIVRARGVCQNCGESNYRKLQCAHIVSRRYAATRTDLDNAFALCAGCHMKFTLWPLEFAKFTIEQIGGDAYDRLREKAEAGIPCSSLMFWRGEVERLTPIWNAIQEAA